MKLGTKTKKWEKYGTEFVAHFPLPSQKLMARLPAVRFLSGHSYRPRTAIASLLAHLSNPISTSAKLYLFFPPTLYYSTKPISSKIPAAKTRSTPRGKQTRSLCSSPITTFWVFIIFCSSSLCSENTLVFKQDERLGNGGSGSLNGNELTESASTIAAIVTPIGGPPGAVGIVRLSGPSAVGIVGRVFRPARKKKRKNYNSYSWRPTSHVVEYGLILDPNGDVVDEVCHMWL